jgi:hypothetical protein
VPFVFAIPSVHRTSPLGFAQRAWVRLSAQAVGELAHQRRGERDCPQGKFPYEWSRMGSHLPPEDLQARLQGVGRREIARRANSRTYHVQEKKIENKFQKALAFLMEL